MHPREGKVARPPASKELPLAALLLLQRALNHRRVLLVAEQQAGTSMEVVTACFIFTRISTTTSTQSPSQKTGRLVWVIAEKAAPRLHQGVKVKDVKVAGRPQLLNQHLLVLGAGEAAGDQREEGPVVQLQRLPAVLQRVHRRLAGAQRRTGPRLQRQEHQVNPQAATFGAHHKVTRPAVQAVLALCLAVEVDLRHLLRLAALLNGDLHRLGNLHEDLCHVRLDLVDVLLAEVLHRVPHRVGLKDGHAIGVGGRGGGGGGLVDAARGL